MTRKIYFNNIYKPEAVEEFLAKQAEAGLMFVKQKGFYYFFEECEPKKVSFVLRLDELSEADVSYLEIDGWKLCYSDKKRKILYSENCQMEKPRADESVRLKSIKNNILRRKSPKLLILLIAFLSLLTFVLVGVNRAQLLIRYLHIIAIVIGLAIYLLVDVFEYLHLKAYKVLKCSVAVVALVVAFVLKASCYKGEVEVLFGYRDILVSFSGEDENTSYQYAIEALDNVDVESYHYLSAFGEIIGWTENLYFENDTAYRLEYEILKTNNEYINDLYLSNMKKEACKKGSLTKHIDLNANEFFYSYDENSKHIYWLVVYDDMILKVGGKYIHDVEIEKVALYAREFYGENQEKAKGIDLEAVNASAIYADEFEGAPSLKMLKYNGKIYMSIDSLDDKHMDVEAMKTMFQEELCTVYKTQSGQYSDEYEKINKASDGVKLYKIKGYDEEFRVAVCLEERNPNTLELLRTYVVVFQCLNDMMVENGAEIFEDKLHLKDSVCLYGEEMYSYDEPVNIPMESAQVVKFLEAINAGEVIDIWNKDYLKLKKSEPYILSFVDENGLSISINVYEEGYASISNYPLEDIIVKLDKVICEDIRK